MRLQFRNETSFKLMWHRHSCRCLLPLEGHFSTGRSVSRVPAPHNSCDDRTLDPLKTTLRSSRSQLSANAGGNSVAKGGLRIASVQLVSRFLLEPALMKF